jgi:5'(3')-deoxyribonucleotidase
LQIPNKNVGVDLDGVVADIVSQLVRFSRLEFDLHLVPSEFRSENIETCTPMKTEQLRKLFCEPKFFQTMRAIRGARRSLMQLIAAGYVVHIVTDRFWYPEIQDDTRKWLSSRLIRVNSLVFARKTEKQSVAQKLELGSFIEDQRSNANLLSEVCRVLLIDYPYNQGLVAPDVLRVKTLQQAVDVVVRNFMPETAPADETRLQRVV